MSVAGEQNQSAARRRFDPWREIPIYLWSRRNFIVSVIAIAIVFYAVVLLLIPSKFRAEAKIIILPPRFMSDVRTEPLSVETAKNLLESPQIFQQIIDRIRESKSLLDKYFANDQSEKAIAAFVALKAEPLQNSAVPDTEADQHARAVGEKLGIKNSDLAKYLAMLSPAEITAILDWKQSKLDDWNVEKLSKAVEAEDVIEKKTATDIKLSPLLVLRASADSGGKAQLIANTWANLFEKKYADLTITKTTHQFDFIKAQQDESDKELADIQSKIVDYKMTHNLDLYQKQIDQYSTLYSGFLKDYVQKQDQLLSDREKLAQLFNLSAAMENNGKYIGTVMPSQTEPDTTTPLTTADVNYNPEFSRTGGNMAPAAVTKGKASDLVLSGNPSDQQVANAVRRMYEHLREKSIQARDQFVESMQEANSFYRKAPIELMEKDRDQLQKEYFQQLEELRLGRVKLTVSRETLAQVEAELTTTPKFLELRKAVPDQNIAAAVTSARPAAEMQSLSNFSFTQEELNPAWTALIAERLRLQNETNEEQNLVTELEDRLPPKEKQLRDLQETLYQSRLNEQLVKNNLKKMDEANSRLMSTYIDTNNEIATTARQISLLRAEIQQLERSTSETKGIIEDLQEDYNNSEAELARMTSRQNAVQKNADLLLQKLQEAQLAVRQDVSDVSVAATAITPEEHYFPPRAILLIVLTFLTAAVLMGVMGRTRYLDLVNS